MSILEAFLTQLIIFIVATLFIDLAFEAKAVKIHSFFYKKSFWIVTIVLFIGFGTGWRWYTQTPCAFKPNKYLFMF